MQSLPANLKVIQDRKHLTTSFLTFPLQQVQHIININPSWNIRKYDTRVQ
jgi:hypothetical protein